MPFSVLLIIQTFFHTAELFNALTALKCSNAWKILVFSSLAVYHLTRAKKIIRLTMAIESILFDNILKFQTGGVKYHSNCGCK